MTTVGSTGFNPYAVNPYANGYLNQSNTGSSMSDDFMFNAYLASMGQGNTQFNPAFTGGFQGQLPQDTFQGSGTTGLSTGLKLGAVAGLGTGAGMYFLGGDNVVPYANGKFSDKILTSVEESTETIAKKKALEELEKAKKGVYEKVTVSGNKITVEQHEAIKEFISLKEAGKEIPKELKEKLPKSIVSAKDLGKLKSDLYTLERALENIDYKKLQETALKEAKNNHLGTQLKEMENLTKRKSLLEGLATDADRAKIEELIKKNPKAFGIEATETAEIEAAAKAKAAKFGTTRQTAIDEITTQIEKQTKNIERARATVNTEYARYWDSTSKTLTEAAPPELKSAVRNFKITKAGKYGLIAAGIGLAIGWLFGGNKS